MTDTLATPYVTVRPLPPEEWERLRALPLFSKYGLPDPRLTRVIVAETPEGQIVGTWAALTTVHLDGLWVDEAYRKANVAPKLLRRMKAMLSELGIVHSFTMVDHGNPEVLILALKAGFTRVPMDLLFLDLTEEK